MPPAEPSAAATPSSSSSGTAINTSTSSVPSSRTTPSSAPTPTPSVTPKLRLKTRDLTHSGASRFLISVNRSATLQDATSVLSLLYQRPTNPTRTRSVTLVLRDKSVVAYTTGTELDRDHEDIHFSLSYILPLWILDTQGGVTKRGRGGGAG